MSASEVWCHVASADGRSVPRVREQAMSTSTGSAYRDPDKEPVARDGRLCPRRAVCDGIARDRLEVGAAGAGHDQLGVVVEQEEKYVPSSLTAVFSA